MPSALLARRLRSSLGCQKQVVAGHRGRSANKYMRLSILLLLILGTIAAQAESTIVKAPPGLRNALSIQAAIDVPLDIQDRDKAVSSATDAAIKSLGIYMDIDQDSASRIDALTAPDPTTIMQIQEEILVIRSYLADRPLPYHLQELVSTPSKLTPWQAELALRLCGVTKHIVQKQLDENQ